MALVNSVCGNIDASELGTTLIHEHLLFGYPGWYGDATVAPFHRRKELEAAASTLKGLKEEHGLNTWVDVTPNECGRDPLYLKEVSEESGVHIVCATGYYTEREGAPAYFRQRSALTDIAYEIRELIFREITQGIRDTGIRAGVIKVASGKGGISDYERAFFRAAAWAQQDTGVPIITHTHRGTGGAEQVDLLTSEGADPSRIVVGHMSDNTDLGHQLSVLDRGAYSGFDRMGLQGIRGFPMDRERLACLTGLLGAGYGKRLLLSHDYIHALLGRPMTPQDSVAPLLADWNPSHLFRNIIPALRRAGASQEQVEDILIHNPRRLFQGGA